MSHLAKINVEIRDLEALAAACRELGGELARGVTEHGWYGRSVGDTALPDGFTAEMLGHCEHVIRFPGIRYEAGVYRNPKGAGYVVMFDHYGYAPGHHDGDKLAEKLGGNHAPKLVQLYGVHKVMAEARRKGWACQRTIAANGTINLQLSGRGL